MMMAPRENLKQAAKHVDKDGWLYFACKRVQHGSNYGMKEKTMSDQILKDSYKLFGEPIAVEPSVCAQLQRLYFNRYVGVLSWHERIKRQLKETGIITSASGHRRIFFGRRDDYDTFIAACSDEPQNNTSYVTNLAIYKLWTDPENRLQETGPNGHKKDDSCRVDPVHNTLSITPGTIGSIRVDKNVTQIGELEKTVRSDLRSTRVTLRVQPLHQVHDALIGQFRKEDVTWAIGKIRQWFNNPITIAGQQITIPFEGVYGTSWGCLKEGVI
jgi:hypothetical protein